MIYILRRGGVAERRSDWWYFFFFFKVRKYEEGLVMIMIVDVSHYGLHYMSIVPIRWIACTRKTNDGDLY